MPHSGHTQFDKQTKNQVICKNCDALLKTEDIHRLLKHLGSCEALSDTLQQSWKNEFDIVDKKRTQSQREKESSSQASVVELTDDDSE